jgi:hypothetical protein
LSSGAFGITMVTKDPFTLIIPAHNEAAVIGRCLKSVLADATEGQRMQILVAANGCTDKTADIARTFASSIEVIELTRGSKAAAMNAANQSGRHFPRIYLDADVECSFTTLAALVEALRDETAMIAAPGIRIDLTRANAFVRAYYRVWLRQPFAREGKGGAGCYAISQAAADQIGAFPDIIADDLWIQSRFPDAQRRVVRQDDNGNPVFTTIHPPRTALDQIRVEARRQIGNRELRRSHPSPHPVASGGKSGIIAALRGGSGLTSVAIFFAIKLAARLLAKWQTMRGRSGVWTRDVSSRAP